VKGNEVKLKELKSGEELEKAKRNRLTLLDFSAPWCAPCRFQEPIMRQLAILFEGKAYIAMVSIDESRDVASNLGIQSIPTLILFRNGKEVQRFVGLQSEATLSEALNNLLK